MQSITWNVGVFNTLNQVVDKEKAEKLFGQVASLVAMTTIKGRNSYYHSPSDDWFTLAFAHGARDFSDILNELVKHQKWGNPEYSVSILSLLLHLYKKDPEESIRLAYSLVEDSLDFLDKERKEKAKKKTPLAFHLIEHPDDWYRFDSSLLTHKPFLEKRVYESLEPINPYLYLIEEINVSYQVKCYTATAILLRKLLENILMTIMKKKYASDKSILNEFYDEKKGRIKDLSLLAESFEKRFDTDFKPLHGVSRKIELGKFKSILGGLKNNLDLSTHVLLTHPTEEEILRWREDFNKIIDLFITIWTALKN